LSEAGNFVESHPLWRKKKVGESGKNLCGLIQVDGRHWSWLRSMLAMKVKV
jgi:hypothetical protein